MRLEDSEKERDRVSERRLSVTQRTDVPEDSVLGTSIARTLAA